MFTQYLMDYKHVRFISSRQHLMFGMEIEEEKCNPDGLQRVFYLLILGGRLCLQEYNVRVTGYYTLCFFLVILFIMETKKTKQKKNEWRPKLLPTIQIRKMLVQKSIKNLKEEWMHNVKQEKQIFNYLSFQLQKHFFTINKNI